VVASKTKKRQRDEKCKEAQYGRSWCLGNAIEEVEARIFSSAVHDIHNTDTEGESAIHDSAPYKGEEISIVALTDTISNPAQSDGGQKLNNSPLFR
jgi:hypothetical protein